MVMRNRIEAFVGRLVFALYWFLAEVPVAEPLERIEPIHCDAVS